MFTPVPQTIDHITGSYNADGGYTHSEITVITATLTADQVAALTSNDGRFCRYFRVPFNTSSTSDALLTHLLDSDALKLFGDTLTATIPRGSGSFFVPNGIVATAQGDHAEHALISAGYQTMTGWHK